eukprot:507351_1
MEQNKPILGMKSTMNDGYQLYLKKLFDRGMIHQPESLILTHTMDGNTHKMKYSEFRIYTSQLASALYNKYNIYIGDIISTFMWNNVRHMALYYTIPCIGSVLNPLNIRLHATELAYIISHSQPKIIFIDENLLLNFEKVLDINPLNTVKAFVICGNNQLKSTYIGKHSLLKNRIIDYDELITKYGSKIFNKWPLNLNEKSGCFLNYTSGTTGNPKGVINSHRSTSLRIILELVRYSANDCILGLPPMFHAGGWWVTFCALTMGFKVLLPNNCYEFNDLMNWSVTQDVNIMFGVPTMILGLAQALKTNPNKFQKFKGKLRILTGGTAIPGHVVNWLWKEWKIDVTHGWGMTECIPGTLSTRVYRRRDLLKTDEEKTQNVLKQGTFDPLIKSKLVNPENSNIIVPKNGKDYGEILVRGPCVTRQYFKGVSPKTFINGWLKTGDIAIITPENEMTITDRSKDLIKSGGEWISSQDIENYTMKMDEIALACVVGQYHPKWDERPIVIVQKQVGENVTKEQVLKHIGTKFAKFQIPDDVLFWDEIPLTGSGKMSKKTVRDMLLKDKYKLPTAYLDSKL